MIVERILKGIAPIETVIGLVLTLALAGAVLWVYLTGRDHGAEASADRISRLQAELYEQQSAARSLDFLESARKRFAEANAAAYKEALRQSEAALAEANREKAQIADEFARWKRTWGGQSRQCTAARQALDAACPELKDY